MYQNCHCDSIANIPSIEEISSNEAVKYKVTLPVYCLSLFKSCSWKPNAPGILYVTDFTTYPYTAFNNQVLPHNIKLNFHLNADTNGRLESEKVLSINVPNYLMEKVSKELRRTTTNMNDYDFNNPDNCQFEQEGIFSRAVFSLKLYRGAVEGNLISLTTLDKENIPSFYSDDPSIDNLVVRFMNYSNAEAIRHISRHFPISDFMSPTSTNKRSNYQMGPQSTQRSDERPTKIQRMPQGTALAFHQHKDLDDTQRPITANTLPNASDDMPSSFYQSQNGTSFANSGFSSLDEFLVNKITISKLKMIPFTMPEIKKEALFEVAGYIRGVMPSDPFIIKPYKRTLKVASFKIIITDDLHHSILSTHNTLQIEFNTEKEICDFLLVDEVEEIYDKMVQIQKAILRLKSNNATLKNLRVKRCASAASQVVLRPYWTSLTNLNDLIK